MANVGINIKAGPQNMTVTRKFESNSAVYVAAESAADRILSVTRHAWLLLVLQLYRLPQCTKPGRPPKALLIVRVETRGHAPHQTQAKCPRLARASTHKACAFEQWTLLAHAVFVSLRRL